MNIGIAELIMILMVYGIPILILYMLFLYLRRISERLERIEEKLDRIER